MLETYLIKRTLSSLFDYLNLKATADPTKSTNFDFLISKDGKITAINVISQNPTEGMLAEIEDNISQGNKIDTVCLITPDNPNKESITGFNKLIKGYNINLEWVGINKFIRNQKLGITLDKNLSKALTTLQAAAVTSKFEDYDDSHIGPNVETKNLLNDLKKNYDELKDGKSSFNMANLDLTRQFPLSIIKKLSNDKELGNQLSVGLKYEDSIIILTDLKNFSTLVSYSDPEELSNFMSDYYVSARNIVFKYNGILDKFIGDAVLAIFNYPNRTSESFSNAINFSAELISMGKEKLEKYQEKLDYSIETGTRIGIASGPITPLNIGNSNIELTFIGDKINLASRLESKCAVNGILISNRFKNKLQYNDPDFYRKFEITRCEDLEAKGQKGPLKTWQIASEELLKIGSSENEG